METPKIVHPITTDEFGFYKLYFTISNTNSNNPLTPKATEVISIICSEDKDFLNKKQFKHELAKKLNVKTPRIYKILTELLDRELIQNVDNKLQLHSGLKAMQSNIKYLLEKNIHQFNYEMLFQISDD